MKGEKDSLGKKGRGEDQLGEEMKGRRAVGGRKEGEG